MKVTLADETSNSVMLFMLQQQHNAARTAVFEAKAPGHKLHVLTTAALPPMTVPR